MRRKRRRRRRSRGRTLRRWRGRSGRRSWSSVSDPGGARCSGGSSFPYGHDDNVGACEMVPNATYGKCAGTCRGGTGRVNTRLLTQTASASPPRKQTGPPSKGFYEQIYSSRRSVSHARGVDGEHLVFPSLVLTAVTRFLLL